MIIKLLAETSLREHAHACLEIGGNTLNICCSLEIKNVFVISLSLFLCKYKNIKKHISFDDININLFSQVEQNYL